MDTAAEPRGSPERRRGRWPAALVAMLAILTGSALLRARIAAIPLERDEGEYAYIAREWARGAVPYRDAFDQKPPGVFAVYRLAFALGADSVAGIHWMGHAWLAAALLPIVALGLRLDGLAVGAAAAASTAVLAMDSSVLGNAANTELFTLLPLAAGVYLAVLGGGRAAATGAFAALALCFKPVALPIVAWPIAWWAVRPWPPGRDAVRRAAAFVAGAAAVLGPMALYFVLRGAGAEAWDALVAHNLAYASSVPLSQYPHTLTSGAGPVTAAQWPWWLAAAAGALVAPGVERRRWLPVTAWLLAALAATSAAGYFRPHYFMFVVPPVALLGAAGLHALARRFAPRSATTLTLAGAVASCAWPVVRHADYFRARSPELTSRTLYAYQPFAESALAAEWIRRRTSEGDTVFVYGSEPQILFHAGRRSASRYIFLYPLYARAADAGQRQAEVLDELRRAPPRIVVVVLNTASLGPEPLLPRLLETELRQMLRRAYTPVAATVLGPEGLARLVEPDSAGRIVVEPFDRPTLQIWERSRSPRAALAPR